MKRHRFLTLDRPEVFLSRPHSSLGYLTPAAFAAKVEEQDATDAPSAGGSLR
jgi:hypothetical protein